MTVFPAIIKYEEEEEEDMTVNKPADRDRLNDVPVREGKVFLPN
jgi:hypothetical protein